MQGGLKGMGILEGWKEFCLPLLGSLLVQIVPLDARLLKQAKSYQSQKYGTARSSKKRFAARQN
jgi:hypothetical protein